MSINNRLDKYIAIYLHKEILCYNKKEHMMLYVTTYTNPTSITLRGKHTKG